MLDSVAHSIELNVSVGTPKWDDEFIRIMLGQDALGDGDTCTFMGGRQTRFHPIGE